MQTQSLIALHGAYYDNNFGDLLLIKIFEQWIQSATKSTVVYPLVPKAEQSRFQSYFPNSAFGLQNSRLWKALIYGGGGHFGEPDSSSQKGYKGYRNWSMRFFLRHVLPAELCIQQGIPYAIVGVGAGPISNVFVRQEVKRIFSNASVISVRDTVSKQFVEEQLGIHENVKLIPDAALTITRADIPAKAMETVERILGSYAQMPLLGIHHARYILADTPQAEVMRTALLSSLATAPDLVPVIFADDGGSKFSEPCDRLAQLIQEATGKSCLSVPFKGVWETVALISKLSAVITTKLHVGIIAYALGIYSESFAIHSKVARFYEQTGRSSQCTLFRDLNQSICLEKIERAIEASQSQTSIVDINWQKIKHEASLNQEVVASFLDWVIEHRTAA